MSEIHSGSCLCGAVLYRVHGALREVIFCHCSQCRKQTGLYYASTNCANSQIEVEGGDNITWYQSSEQAKRGFCKSCGSALFWKHRDADYVSIVAGSLDQPSGLPQGYHIFCADKGDFYDIKDGLEQFAKSKPGLVTNSD